MKILFYDIETTGLNYWEHEIHQLAGFVVQDDKITERFNFHLKPAKNNISEEALNFSKVSKEQILKYPDSKEALKDFVTLLKKYDKIILAGYNIAAFDNLFLKEWFKNNNLNIYDFVYTNCLDVMVLTSQYLLTERESMSSFSLASVADKLTINLEKDSLHESIYDIELTYKIYKAITK